MACAFTNPNTLIGGGCQFGHQERVYQWHGREYCYWHVPLDARPEILKLPIEEFQRRLDSILPPGNARTPANLTGAIFDFPFIQTNHRLPALDFSNATFVQGIDCTAAQFIEPVSFNDACFLKDATFNEAKFEKEVSLVSAVFKATGKFRGAQFSEATTFLNGVTFDGDCDMSDCNFSGRAEFTGAIFHERATFSSAHFHKAAFFTNARFNAEIRFSCSQFLELADFNGVIFGSTAMFSEANLSRTARFQGATFKAITLFDSHDEGSNNFGPCTWHSAIFEDFVRFQNRRFTSTQDFSDVVFHKAPDFHGCQLHESMTFPVEENFRERSGVQAAQAYRTLRLGTEKLSARREAGMFYSLEQASLRQSPGIFRRHERVLSWLYEKVSDYGRNMLRPLLWLLGLAAFFGICYAMYTAPFVQFGAAIDWDRVGRALSFSMEQVIQPGGVWRDVTTELFGGPGQMPLWLRWICTLQSLVSVLLISLSLLAVRWRFKRD